MRPGEDTKTFWDIELGPSEEFGFFSLPGLDEDGEFFRNEPGICLGASQVSQSFCAIF